MAVKFNLSLSESDMKLIYNSLLYYRKSHLVSPARINQFIFDYELEDFKNVP